jgi:diacylglycerol kinase (ATP)
MVLRKLLFIINPKAGKKLGPELLPLIEQKLKGKLQYEIALWKNVEEFGIIADKLKNGGFTDAIAVGGDGTVNMVGKTVLGTTISLGILPAGSGNGLARSLKLPMKKEKALDAIVEGKTSVVDSGEVNGSSFFCTSGVGFDAHIGNLFATSTTRGLKTYIKIIRKEFRTYEPQTYLIKTEKEEIERTAFLITVGNAGQYGNDFYIAPGAKMNDGIFHISILRPFKLFQVAGLVTKILQGKADKSKLMETFSCKELTISRKKKDFVHYDGEPKMEVEKVVFKMNPLSIRVIVGEKFTG